MTAEELYDAICHYLVDSGWRREDDNSGWWWKEGGADETIGNVLEEQFRMDQIDLRVMRDWEPQEFWG